MTEKPAARLSRERILDAARRHFARFGYRKASLSDIAGDLGVVKGALYYHIPGGKRELLDAVMAREDERMITAMTAAVETEADPGRALVAAVEAKINVLRQLKDLLDVGREVGEEINKLMREREREFTRRERALIEELLARGEARGVFCALRSRSVAAAAIQAMIQALQVPEIYTDDHGHPLGPRLMSAAFDLVLRGLEVRS